MKHSIHNHIKKLALSNLAKSYSPLDYCHQLASSLQAVFPNDDFSNLDKFQLHQQINSVLKDYRGEQSIKYFLFNKFKKKNLVAAFETRVQKSRLDFLTINGVSTSYEIKSSLDNLTKLGKQSADYVKAFEYNCIIIDQCHLQKAVTLIPESFGIWLFSDNKRKIYRKPKRNINIEPEVQLDLLTKRELHIFFSESCKRQIFNAYCAKEINQIFKRALKARYNERWSFVVNNSDQILPVDIQFFFNVNINPRQIYQF